MASSPLYHHIYTDSCSPRLLRWPSTLFTLTWRGYQADVLAIRALIDAVVPESAQATPITMTSQLNASLCFDSFPCTGSQLTQLILRKGSSTRWRSHCSSLEPVGLTLCRSDQRKTEHPFHMHTGCPHGKLRSKSKDVHPRPLMLDRAVRQDMILFSRLLLTM